MSTPGPVPKHWLVFVYIRSEDYELDQNFVKTKKTPSHTSNDKVKLFCENIVVIEEELFDDTNLTDGATFKTALIKREKSRFNIKKST